MAISKLNIELYVKQTPMGQLDGVYDTGYSGYARIKSGNRNNLSPLSNLFTLYYCRRMFDMFVIISRTLHNKEICETHLISLWFS